MTEIPQKGKIWTVIANDQSEWTNRNSVVKSPLEIPLKQRTPTAYFVNSQHDLFYNDGSVEAFDQLDNIFGTMFLTPWHTYFVVTKNPANMYQYLDPTDTRQSPYRVSKWVEAANTISWSKLKRKNRFNLPDFKLPLSHVYFGVAVENQQTADNRIPWVLKTTAAKRFLVYNPSEKIEVYPYLTSAFRECPRPIGDPHPIVLDFVIAKATNDNSDLVRDLARQCEGANIPFFTPVLS